MCPQAVLAARITGSAAVLHVQDLELDAAVSLGFLRRRSLLARLAEGIEGFMLRRFDLVSTISPEMRAKIVQKGVSHSRTAVVPNWAALDTTRPQEGSTSLRDVFGVPAGAVVVLYSGNLGAKQGLECLVEAAALLQEHADILFMVFGDGVAREHMILTAEQGGVKNIRFGPVQPRERLNGLLSMADIHVITERAGVGSAVMPSKLGGALASARPIVASCADSSALARAVREAGAGIVVEPEDSRALARALGELAGSPAARHRMGQNGRAYAEAHLNRQRILRAFEQRLGALRAARSR